MQGTQLRTTADMLWTQAPALEQRAATRTALSLPADLPIDKWTSIGTHLLTISDASAWWIGDWLIFGQKRYEDRYRRAMVRTSLHYQTLRNYAWVARKFPPGRRREKLTFQHHVEVARFEPDVQDHWLDLAESFGWSRNELRKQVRDSEAPDEIASDYAEVRVSFCLDKGRLTRWEAAARSRNRDLFDWIAEVLDNAISARQVSGGLGKVAARPSVD